MKVLWRTLLLLAMLLGLMLLLPSPSPLSGAFAEEYTALPVDDSAGPAPSESNYLADGTGYQDDSLTVMIREFREYDTTILAAYITVKDASQLRTAMAGKFGSTRDIPGTKIAERNNAVFAVNGDYFNFNNEGYIIRQGTLYRDNPAEGADVLLIDDLGDFHIIQEATSEKIAAFPGTVVNSFSFGPALVIGGEAQTISENKHIASEKPTQRMVIAQTGPLAYLCVATEGPENTGSVGLTLEQTANMMVELGCVTAYNLDGGSSSTMVLNNKKINALSTHKVRPIWDILYFVTLVEPAE
ncbi:MAG: phosphodiester glycosidase family protein [Eubacteriales bacterium]|nr:phosphodiester glycosidase family protein [Eubacteriales bacterium]